MSSEEEIVSKALNNYYKLKNQYENKYQQMKNKIIHDESLNKKQKRDKFLKIKKQCINCKQDGGTIFSNKDRTLKALCGNTTNPCKLSITIEMGDHQNIENVLLENKKDINETKNNIIKQKLDLLFQYNDEDKIMTNFNSLRKDLSELMEIEITYLQEYMDIVNDKEKNIEIKNLVLSYYNLIEQLKENINLYKESHNNKIIKDIVLLYNSHLYPLVKKIMKKKYEVNDVIYNETTNKYKIVQEKVNYKDLIINIAPTNVTSETN